MRKMDYESVFEKEKLLSIVHEMKKEHFKPGYDNMTAQSAETWLEINYDNLLARLKNGQFSHSPY